MRPIDVETEFVMVHPQQKSHKTIFDRPELKVDQSLFLLSFVFVLYLFQILDLCIDILPISPPFQGLTRGDGSDPDAEVYPEQRVIRVDGSREKLKESAASSSSAAGASTARRRRNESGDYDNKAESSRDARDRRGHDDGDRGRVSEGRKEGVHQHTLFLNHFILEIFSTKLFHSIRFVSPCYQTKNNTTILILLHISNLLIVPAGFSCPRCLVEDSTWGHAILATVSLEPRIFSISAVNSSILF